MRIDFFMQIFLIPVINLTEKMLHNPDFL